MDMFQAIERAFQTERESGRLERAVDEWSSACLLGDATTLEDLIRRCRGPIAGSRDQKDLIHAALCQRAFGETADEAAGILLLWLFLPGLSQVLARFLARPHIDEDDLIAELIAGFLDAASRVKPTSRHIARQLLLGARRRAKRAHRPSVDSVPATSETIDSDTPHVEEMIADDHLARALAHNVVTSSEVELIFATRATISRCAARQGLSLAAAQQARHRARQRLAEWLKDLYRASPRA